MKLAKLFRYIFFLPLMFLLACQQDEPAPDFGYIRGNFGSEYLNFTQTNSKSYTADYNYYDPTHNLGQVSISRFGKGSDKRQLEIGISGVNLDTLSVPFEFNSKTSGHFVANQTIPVAAGVGFLDIPSTPLPFGITSVEYWGGSSSLITFTVTSKKDDILEGTFEGNLYSLIPGTTLIPVKNGEFRIKLIRKN